MNGISSQPGSSFSASQGVPACPLLLQGHPVSLQLLPDERLHRAVVLGMKPGEFIIVKPPLSLLAAASLAAESVARVRFEDEGVIYGFDSPVQNALKQPSPILFVAYPKDFQVHALRRHQRIKCLIPTVVEGETFSRQGLLRDISAGGCLFVTGSAGFEPRAAAKGETVELSLPVQGIRMEKFTAEIRGGKVEDGMLTLGLAFHGEAGGGAIARFVDRLRAADGMREKARPESPPQSLSAVTAAAGMRDATARVGDAADVTIKALAPLDVQFTGSHLYDQSMVLGVDGQSLVIAEMPLATGLKCCPKPGMGLRARFEEQGSYYGFMTSVAKFITKPRPMFFFAYPKKIEILARRKHPRVRCLLPVGVENEHFDAQGFITDISLGGCRVLANLDSGEPILNVMGGDRVDVVLPLDGVNLRPVRAKVKSATLSGNTAVLGLVFTMDKALVDKMAALISRMEAASV
jgi:c-di-GMP-binding flagellar brake protein YcgR